MSIFIPRPPFLPRTKQLLGGGGYKPILRAQASGSAQGRAGVIKLKIVPAVEGTRTKYGIRRFIERDGHTRNLRWHLCDGRHAITSTEAEDEKEYLGEGDAEAEMHMNMEREEKRGMAVAWVVAFKDMVEARRFIRTWHRREWPDYDQKDMRELGVVAEQPAMIHAELLW